MRQDLQCTVEQLDEEIQFLELQLQLEEEETPPEFPFLLSPVYSPLFFVLDDRDMSMLPRETYEYIQKGREHHSESPYLQPRILGLARTLLHFCSCSLTLQLSRHETWTLVAPASALSPHNCIWGILMSWREGPISKTGLDV